MQKTLSLFKLDYHMDIADHLKKPHQQYLSGDREVGELNPAFKLYSLCNPETRLQSLRPAIGRHPPGQQRKD